VKRYLAALVAVVAAGLAASAGSAQAATLFSSPSEGPPPPTAQPLPELTSGAVRVGAWIVLKRDFGEAFTPGQRHRHHRFFKRLSCSRVTCAVGWSYGRFQYEGRITIWLLWDSQGQLIWNYAYQIKQTDKRTPRIKIYSVT
jgi:hypothetical protein